LGDVEATVSRLPSGRGPDPTWVRVGPAAGRWPVVACRPRAVTPLLAMTVLLARGPVEVLLTEGPVEGLPPVRPAAMPGLARAGDSWGTAKAGPGDGARVGLSWAGCAERPGRQDAWSPSPVEPCSTASGARCERVLLDVGVPRGPCGTPGAGLAWSGAVRRAEGGVTLTGGVGQPRGEAAARKGRPPKLPAPGEMCPPGSGVLVRGFGESRHARPSRGPVTETPPDETASRPVPVPTGAAPSCG
jgi:hypothetical protein